MEEAFFIFGYVHALSTSCRRKVSCLLSKDLLAAKSGNTDHTVASDRRLLNAVLWIASASSPWRDLRRRLFI